MLVDKTIKISSVFLDTTSNIIVVYPETQNPTALIETTFLRNRSDTHAFIMAQDTHVHFTEAEYETIFYEEIRKLKRKIDNMPDFTFYIMSPNEIMNYEVISNILEPKMRIMLKDYSNVVFLWNIEKPEVKKDKYWGFVVLGRANVFLEDDIAIPFETEFATRYFDIEALDKSDAKSQILKLDKEAQDADHKVTTK